MIWIAIVVWVLLAMGLASLAVLWMTKREQGRKKAAYLEILRERGIEPKPNEPIKLALLRAKRAEQTSSRPPAPVSHVNANRYPARPVTLPGGIRLHQHQRKG